MTRFLQETVHLWIDDGDGQRETMFADGNRVS